MLIVVLGTSIYLVIRHLPDSNTDNLAVDFEPTNHEDVAEQVVLNTPEADSRPPVGESGDTLDIWKECPIDEWANTVNIPSVEKWAGLELEVTDTCLRAREQHMLSQPYEPDKYIFSFISFREPRTLTQVFDNPEQDLNNIKAALNREECLTPEVTANWDLKESCYAESFGNFAMFYDYCGSRRLAGRELKAAYERQFRTGTDTRNPANEHMKADVSRLWKTYLERSWVDDHCLQYSPSLYFIDTDWNSELYERLVEIGKERVHFRAPVDFANGDAKGVWQILLSIGARLGDEAAALVYFPGPDRELRQYFDEKQPWRIYWREMWNQSNPTVTRLSVAMELVVSLDESDVSFNMEWLVDHVCTFHRVRSRDVYGRLNPKDSPSCQTLINELRFELDSLDQRLPFLDEFERVAIEIGIFQ